jgi:predicted PurR-regulated permease PerM
VETEELDKQAHRPVISERESSSAEKESRTTLESSGEGEVALGVKRESVPVRSWALKGLFLLALFYTFYLARTFLLPIALALILTFVLAPVVRWLRHKMRIPEGVSAAGIVVLVITMTIYHATLLKDPAIDWLNRAPAVISEIQYKLRVPIQSVTEATEQLGAVAGGGEAEQSANGTPVLEVREKKPGWGERVLNWAPVLLGNAAATIILLFFFLTYGDLFLLKVVRVLPTFSDKKNAVEIAHKIESQISSYLATITVINMGLGAAIGVAMSLWGMPNPILWGFMGGILNFIPYLGAVIGVSVVGVVALTQFDTPGYALLVPLTYYALTATEGYFVTPILLGRRLILNPVVIFLGFLFWGWMWSIPGMLLAVPILAVFKIFCDHIKPLAPVGEFMGR